jgi:hypothetical protein
MRQQADQKLRKVTAVLYNESCIGSATTRRILKSGVRAVIDYVRLVNDAYGIASNRPSIRDRATEVRRLLQIVEVQKGELQRLRRLLEEGLMHGALMT